MIDAGLLVVARQRIADVRQRRCGPKWSPPPPDWAQAVRRAWPAIFHLAPSRVPDGWCDLLLALVDHLAEIGGEPKILDAFEDMLSGSLAVRYACRDGQDFDAINRVMDAYEAISMETCRECGEPGGPTTGGRTTQVLCRHHRTEDRHG